MKTDLIDFDNGAIILPNTCLKELRYLYAWFLASGESLEALAQ